MRNPFLLSPARRDDDGFVLLETLVSIGLIAVVMAAFTTFFVNAVSSTSLQRATQVATQIANSAVDMIRATPSSDLPPLVRAIEPQALSGTGSPVVVPSLGGPQQTINGISYRTSVALGTCVMDKAATSNATCSAAAVSTGIAYLRAAVTVTWSGARCPAAGCTYVTSTLISAVDDPLFNVSQSPPVAPTLTYPFSTQASNPGVLTVAVGDTVDLAATITAVPTFKVTITAGNLPVGLSLDTATGRITGTPSVVAGSTPITLTVTDGFGRATAVSFTVTVLAAVSGVPPAAQASLIGTAITALNVTATGGNVPYTWSDPNTTLPPGLSLATVNNQAVITGTPTTAGLAKNGVLPQTFAVVLTIKDSVNRTATVPISWTINYPPFAAAVPGPQTSTVGTADAVPLSVTGGSGSFTWSSTTLPAGFTLTPAGVLSGTPTTVGASSVVLTVTDTKSVKSTNPTVYASQNVTFQLTVYAKPTVTGPGNQSLTVGLAVPSTQLATSCPNTPCTYVLNNGPGTFAINGSGVLTGTVTSAPQTFGTVTVSVTDSAGATGTSAPFVVIVNAAPRVANPGDRTAAAGGADSLDVAALTTGGTGPLTYSASNLPSWLTLNSSTGLITGTAPTTTVTTTGITVTATDTYGFSASSAAFSWAVTGSPPSAPQTVGVVNGNTTVTASWTAPASINGSAVTGYTATLSPGGASCTSSGLTCTISGGLINGVTYSLTVTATNRFGTGPASAAVRAIPYPADVMSAANGMTLWLDGADPSVLLGSSSCTGAVTTTAIGCWLDKSGQSVANNFVQATPASQPGISTWNGLSAANFADTGDVMTSVKPSANYQTVFVAANVTTANQFSYLFGQSGQDYNVRVGSGTSRSAPNGNDWSFNPAGTNDWANGVKLVNVNGPARVITTDQSSAVKSFTASVSNGLYGRGVVGQIGDVITFDKVLSDTQRHAVEDYLAHKWGISIKPSEPLAVAVVNANNAVNVSWTAPATGVADSYTATLSPGGASCTTTGSSCTISGLAGGAYTVAVTATNDFGTGPPSAGVNALPYPSVMSAANGMSLWLDGSDPNVFFASSACTGTVATTAVGCWKDKSSSGVNFTQSNGTSQPAISTWNGRNAANFATAGRVLNSSSSSGQYRTVFVAANTTGAAGTYNYLFGQAAVNNDDFNVRVGTTIPRSNPNQNDWSFNTGSPTHNWYNGEQATTKGQAGPMVTTDEAQSQQSFAASVGSAFNKSGVNRGLVGQIGDVITFNRVLTTAERKSVEAYLGSKWGVVVTP